MTTRKALSNQAAIDITKREPREAAMPVQRGTVRSLPSCTAAVCYLSSSLLGLGLVT
jgi:hypothetical protein